MTAVIPFTRKRNIKRFKETILFCKMTQLSSEVKYLGITLYKGLTWKKQLDSLSIRPTKPSGHAEAHLGNLGD
jgi:hypothetical protein